jgi:type VI secretion system protein
MKEERLLERIRRWEKEPLSRERENPKRAVESVVRHLQRLLNTRQGSVTIAEDYGVPDFMHLLRGGPEAPGGVEITLRNVIEKYEPRLSSVRVRYVALDDHQLTHRFDVQAKLRVDDRPVYLETVMSSDGRVQVLG